jgi:hypothetical protein
MTPKKGNKNAFKHGIYSKFIAVDDDGQLKGMKKDRNTDELALARVQLVKALDERDRATDPDQKRNWDHAVRHWTEIILTAVRDNAKMPETEDMIFTSLLDAVRAANDKQHVKR